MKSVWRAAWYAGAALWGVGEATFFFVVPDVLLTFALLRLGVRRAFGLAVVAAFSAALAGLAMWFWGRTDVTAARHAMLLVPAVGPDLLARAGHELGGFWIWHMVVGAVTGVPYKLYAIEAGARDITILPFFLASFAARLARFAYSIGLVVLGREGLKWAHREHWAPRVLAVGWVALYAVYWSLRAAVP